MKYSLNKKLEKFTLRLSTPNAREMTYEKIINSLSRFPIVKDSYKMSYYKYQCRIDYYPKILILAANFLSFFADIVAILTTFVPSKSYPKAPQNIVLLEKSYSVPYTDILPQMMVQDDEELVVTEYCNKKFGRLSKEAKRIFYQGLIRYPFRFYFHYLLYKELVAHTFFINTYNPKKVAVYVNERNPILPLLTDMYEADHRELLSFMHGEYNLQLVQAFMKFSKYYVWSEKYVSMMRDILKCGIQEYIVYTPLKEQKKWNLENVKPEYKYTYCFSSEESEEAVKKIFSVLNIFEKHGDKCKVRVHPRNTVNLQVIEKHAVNLLIEYPKDISLEKSLGATEYVIGLGTTVLIDAITEGRKVVLDDISNPFRFEQLKKLGNRSFDMAYTLLSDHVRSAEHEA